MRTAGLWPVSPHLRPRPPVLDRAGCPEPSCPLFERGAPEMHSQGWTYDVVDFLFPEEALALPVEGDA